MKPLPRLVSLLFVPLLGLGYSAAARATVARAVTFQEKTQQADSIIVGHCTKSYATFDPSGRWIVTYATFAVDDEVKGQSAGQVIVVTPGGVVGGLRQETIGMPRFAVGDSRALFLKQTELGPTVLFADQGTYDVTENSAGRQIVPTASKLILVDSTTGALRSDREPVRSLEQFRNDIHHALNQDEGSSRTQMEMMRRRQSDSQPSQGSEQGHGLAETLLRFFMQNRIVVGMLAVGMILSAIPLLRRR